MIVYNYDADLEVSDTCVRSSLLSWVELSCQDKVIDFFHGHSLIGEDFNVKGECKNVRTTRVTAAYWLMAIVIGFHTSSSVTRKR